MKKNNTASYIHYIQYSAQSRLLSAVGDSSLKTPTWLVVMMMISPEGELKFTIMPVADILCFLKPYALAICPP